MSRRDNIHADLFILLIVVIGLLWLSGCATWKEVTNAPKPQSFLQVVANVNGQIAALRDLTAFTVSARGEDCISAPYTDLCVAARSIDVKTKEFIEQQGLIMLAYTAANGDLALCKINYGGVELACQDQQDRILFTLIQLRSLLPQGDTQ